MPSYIHHKSFKPAEYMEDTEVFADVFNHMIYKGEKFSVGSCPYNGGDNWNED